MGGGATSGGVALRAFEYAPPHVQEFGLVFCSPSSASATFCGRDDEAIAGRGAPI